MFEINQIVKVKEGVKDTFFNHFDISGWLGKIVKPSYPAPNNGGNRYIVEWGDNTLDNMPKDYETEAEELGLNNYFMLLMESDLEVSEEVEVFNESLAQNNDSWEAREKRIMTILAVEDEDSLSVSEQYLERYMEFLRENLEMPCLLTGIEDFSWEEKYIFGGASKKEYEMLKKTRPSYTDTFELIEPISEYDMDIGLFAKVRRKKDKKVFTLPLADLEATEEESKNYELLHDYSVWLVNYM